MELLGWGGGGGSLLYGTDTINQVQRVSDTIGARNDFFMIVLRLAHQAFAARHIAALKKKRPLIAMFYRESLLLDRRGCNHCDGAAQPPHLTVPPFHFSSPVHV